MAIPLHMPCHRKVPCNPKHLVAKCVVILLCHFLWTISFLHSQYSSWLFHHSLLHYSLVLQSRKKITTGIYYSHWSQLYLCSAYAIPLWLLAAWNPTQRNHGQHRVPCLDLPMLQIFSFPVAPSRLVGWGWAETPMTRAESNKTLSTNNSLQEYG